MEINVSERIEPKRWSWKRPDAKPDPSTKIDWPDDVKQDPEHEIDETWLNMDTKVNPRWSNFASIDIFKITMLRLGYNNTATRHFLHHLGERPCVVLRDTFGLCWQYPTPQKDGSIHKNIFIFILQIPMRPFKPIQNPENTIKSI